MHKTSVLSLTSVAGFTTHKNASFFHFVVGHLKKKKLLISLHKKSGFFLDFTGRVSLTQKDFFCIHLMGQGSLQTITLLFS